MLVLNIGLASTGSTARLLQGLTESVSRTSQQTGSGVILGLRTAEHHLERRRIEIEPRHSPTGDASQPLNPRAILVTFLLSFARNSRTRILRQTESTT